MNLYNPYDKKRFDIENPSLPTGSLILNDYEKKFFNHNKTENAHIDREFIQELQVYRNNHYLGTKYIMNRGNSRANGKSSNKLFYTRSFLEFFVKNKSDDEDIPIVDKIFGIQLNKNQNNNKQLDTPLLRLIDCLIDEFHNETWEWFETEIKDFKKEVKLTH